MASNSTKSVTLPYGKYKVTITNPNYLTSSKIFDINSERQAHSYSYALAKKSSGTGQVFVTGSYDTNKFDDITIKIQKNGTTTWNSIPNKTSTNLPIGNYTITVSRLSWESKVKEVTIEQDKMTSVNINLDKKVFETYTVALKLCDMDGNLIKRDDLGTCGYSDIWLYYFNGQQEDWVEVSSCCDTDGIYILKDLAGGQKCTFILSDESSDGDYKYRYDEGEAICLTPEVDIPSTNPCVVKIGSVIEKGFCPDADGSFVFTTGEVVCGSDMLMTLATSDVSDCSCTTTSNGIFVKSGQAYKILDTGYSLPITQYEFENICNGPNREKYCSRYLDNSDPPLFIQGTCPCFDSCYKCCSTIEKCNNIDSEDYIGECTAETITDCANFSGCDDLATVSFPFAEETENKSIVPVVAAVSIIAIGAYLLFKK